MNIGTLLRKFRDSRSLTTRHIAEKIGVSQSTYMDWEHGKSSPSLKSYMKLTSALGVNPVEFMAYLTGQATEILSAEEKANIADLREMVKYCQNYSDLLREDKIRVENELTRVQELLKERGILTSP
jgi:transcriptional regulator with XRE-family HTH domain